jgi:hypothetical protein
MKKLLVLVFVLAATSSAGATTVFLTDEGTVISAPAGTVRLTITSNADGATNFGILNFDCIVAVTGGDVIAGALNLADCAAYGWDPGLSFNPTDIGTASAEMGVGNVLANGNLNTIIGYVDIAYTGGTQVVSIAPGSGLGGGYHNIDTMLNPLIFSTGVVTIIPEPATLLLLTLGACFLTIKR